MKRILTILLLALASMSATVSAAPRSLDGTIILNESGPLKIGDTVTFDTTVNKLSGNQYPLVYTVCKDDAGNILYGQLDYPDTAFKLGGGASPWLLVGGNATCEGQLRVYGGKERGHDTIVTVATTPSFPVEG